MCFSITDSSMTELGSHGGKITDLSSWSFKGFLLGSAPFRQGLNCSAIIAVMSKGNLPQTEAGSSVAIAPGKAELLSFLKCQPGTGTGNCAEISPCTLSGCCPQQQRQAGSFRTRLSPAPRPNLNIQIETNKKLFFLRLWHPRNHFTIGHNP